MQPTDDLSQVEVRRSRRRARTVTAWREGDKTIVAIPARFTRAQELEWVRRMMTRLAAQERRRRPSDEELAARAADLSARYLGGRARPTSVAWSSNQGRRWGSCTPSDGTIRLSDRLRGMPRWVVDYVLLHELAHLLHAGHGPDFWAELDAYPRTQRAITDAGVALLTADVTLAESVIAADVEIDAIERDLDERCVLL
ncbi:YgjP-like metallopeptidase domain-containing protein, partial [Cellulomonas septica]|uniref:YgjP-like metallopeptidase domain-containing protein n=1 Tax=Cellulomonas septica TaxID=285080 RepID=UPI0031B5BECB